MKRYLVCQLSEESIYGHGVAHFNDLEGVGQHVRTLCKSSDIFCESGAIEYAGIRVFDNVEKVWFTPREIANVANKTTDYKLFNIGTKNYFKIIDDDCPDVIYKSVEIRLDPWSPEKIYIYCIAGSDKMIMTTRGNLPVEPVSYLRGKAYGYFINNVNPELLEKDAKDIIEDDDAYDVIDGVHYYLIKEHDGDTLDLLDQFDINDKLGEADSLLVEFTTKLDELINNEIEGTVKFTWLEEFEKYGVLYNENI